MNHSIFRLLFRVSCDDGKRPPCSCVFTHINDVMPTFYAWQLLERRHKSMNVLVNLPQHAPSLQPRDAHSNFMNKL